MVVEDRESIRIQPGNWFVPCMRNPCQQIILVQSGVRTMEIARLWLLAMETGRLRFGIRFQTIRLKLVRGRKGNRIQSDNNWSESDVRNLVENLSMGMESSSWV